MDVPKELDVFYQALTATRRGEEEFDVRAWLATLTQEQRLEVYNLWKRSEIERRERLARSYRIKIAIMVGLPWIVFIIVSLMLIFGGVK